MDLPPPPPRSNVARRTGQLLPRPFLDSDWPSPLPVPRPPRNPNLALRTPRPFDLMELPETIQEPPEWVPSSPLPPVQTDSKTMDLDDAVTDPLRNAIAFAFSGIEKEDLAEPDYSAQERLELIVHVIEEMQAIADSLAAKKEPKDSQVKRLLADAYAQSVRNYPGFGAESVFKTFTRAINNMTGNMRLSIARYHPDIKRVALPPPLSLTWMDGTHAFIQSLKFIHGNAGRINHESGRFLQTITAQYLMTLAPTEQIFD